MNKKKQEQFKEWLEHVMRLVDISPVYENKSAEEICDQISKTYELKKEEKSLLLNRLIERETRDKVLPYTSVNVAKPTYEKDTSVSVLALIDGSFPYVLSYITDDTGDGKFYMNFNPKKYFEDWTDNVTHWMLIPKIGSGNLDK